MEQNITPEEDQFKEAKEKFFSKYQEWKDKNPELQQRAREIVEKTNLPNISSLNINNEDIFLTVMYGAQLAKETNKASASLDLPRIDYDRQEKGARLRPGATISDIVIGDAGFYKEITKKLSEKMHNKTSQYPLDPEVAVYLLGIGVHEYAHEALFRKAGTEKYDKLIDEYSEHDELFKESGNQADYDSSLHELMSITWEKRVLEKHTPWAQDTIQELQKRIENARERRKNS